MIVPWYNYSVPKDFDGLGKYTGIMKAFQVSPVALEKIYGQTTEWGSEDMTLLYVKCVNKHKTYYLLNMQKLLR